MSTERKLAVSGFTGAVAFWGRSQRLGIALLLGLTAMSVGPLASPAAAATAKHPLGWQATPGLSAGLSPAAVAATRSVATYPNSVDLSQWAPPAGDQGWIGSCASWATGYDYRYWLRNHATGETATFAPTYLYSQLAHGSDTGSSFYGNISILQSQGIDHQSDWTHGTTDYTTQPTAAETAAAAPYKITSGANLFYGASTANQAAIQATMAGGKPVLLAIPVYPEFDAVSSTSLLVDAPKAGEASRGGHAVFAAKYDAAGVWIENSWGAGWGKSGWAELSWAFVNQYAFEAWTMTSGDGAVGLSVTLGASATSVAANASVTLTAQASIDVGPTPYYIVILNGSNAVVRVCSAGTTCGTSVTMATAGSMTYKAVLGTSTGGSPVAISSPVTVTWGRLPASLGLVMVTRAVSGDRHSVTVRISDSAGHAVTGYRGTVHFTSSDTAATLPPNYQFTAADSGVHTFTLGATLKTAGTQWVRATDTVTTSLTGTQTGIVVIAGATKRFMVAITTSAVAGTSRSVTVRAVDAFGNTTAGYRGAIHFTSSDKHAVLPADYTFTTADAGTHNFATAPGVVLKTAGAQSVTATDKVSAVITGTRTGIAVTPGPAARFGVVTVGLFVAGDAHSVTVRAVDAYGNTATGYRGLVLFASSDTKATLPVAYRFTAADYGAHTLALGVALRTAGTQWVKATDSVTASITGTQAGIVVAPRVVRTFTIATASPATMGSGYAVKVRALDAYGNVVTGYRGTIHFTISDARAHLPASYTFTAADAGVHVFTAGSSVAFGTRSTQWLRASDTVTISLTGVQTGIVVR
jgi:hypothetical protein